MHSRSSKTRNWVYVAAIASLASAHAQPNVYVSNIAGNNISVVSSATNSVSGSIPVPLGPTGLAVTPDGGSLYVACQSANVVSVINTTTNSITANIPVGPLPTQLAISPNGARVYVADNGSNQVSVIDTASQTVIATLGVGQNPNGIAFSPDGSRVFVANTISGNVSVIDTSSNTVINTFSAGPGASAVTVAANGARVYVANESAGSVTVHDLTGNLLATINGFILPDALALIPNGSRLLVVNGNGASVAVVDTSSNSVISTMAVDNLPTSVTVSADGSQAFVTNELGYSVSVINLSSYSVVTTISRIGVFPVAVATLQASPAAQGPRCSYSLSPGSASYPSGGGNGSVTVNAPAGCTWSAGSNAGWLSITGGASGNGSGTVFYSAAANQSTSAASGSLTIAGQTFTVSESGIGCSYSLSAYTASFTSVGGAGSVVVNASGGCPWSVASDSSWLTVSSATSGSGTSGILFFTSANSGVARNGNLNIAGQIFQVSQAGSTGGGGSNMALGKAASQSSTYPSSSAGAGSAVDGNTDGSFWDGSVTHTNLDTNAWWQVDLGASATVNSIVIWNRMDCCSSRMSDYWVFVSNTPFNPWDTPSTLQGRAGTWGSHQFGSPYPASTIIAGGAQGQYVRVQLSGTDYLSLAEVQVMGTGGGNLGGSNLAQGKPANQSSTYYLPSSGAGSAVDGNTDGNFWNYSVSHTNQEANPWWQVDLGAQATVGSIVIWNRTDCCSYRLSDYWVFVSTTPFNPWDTPATLQGRAGTWSSHQTATPNPSTTIAIAGAHGQYVRVQLSGTDFLSLAEVQVIGTTP